MSYIFHSNYPNACNMLRLSHLLFAMSDGQDRVDNVSKQDDTLESVSRPELPKLAAIKTYLYFGYSPQNMDYNPIGKPFECVSTRFAQRIIFESPPSTFLSVVLVHGSDENVTVSPGCLVPSHCLQVRVSN
jgi:hypothetical protein